MVSRSRPANAERSTEFLLAQGVILPRPELVVIAPDVALDRIAPGAVLHPFVQLRGPRTRIGPGAAIGEGGPAVLEDSGAGAGACIGTMGPVMLRNVVCGPGTVLGAGAAEDAVFLGKEVTDPAISCGLAFRVRKGSLYEEDANSAQHTDTKMTLLFPWATLGSNVNWCDLLMAGGTGPAFDQFSEVGSGAVHFNFTPRGDKATASMLGNVPEGVFLRSPRIFFGGNGSLIGPARLAFGAVTAAGRRFAGTLGPGLHRGEPEGAEPARSDGFSQEIYGSVKRVFDDQVRFIAELAALDAWYAQARAMIAAGDPDREALYGAGRAMVQANLAERIQQLAALVARMERSAGLIERRSPADPRIPQQRALLERWPAIERHLRAQAAQPMPEALRAGLEVAQAREGRVYTRVIRALDEAAVSAGVTWLEGIARRVAAAELLDQVPALPGARGAS
jgi:UDP-N-acetylglucosamine/UDP-N-acetylgalactosamine diphosphorylase